MRLRATLRAMEQQGGSCEAEPLKRLRETVRAGRQVDAAACLEHLLRLGLQEDGVELARSLRRDVANPTELDVLIHALSPHAEKAQRRRIAGWQTDTRRCHARLWFRKSGPVLPFDEGDIHALLLLALRLSGFRPALDLGKRPRPLLGPLLPLPAGVGGEAEPVDLVLAQDPTLPSTERIDLLNRHLPSGLAVIRWEPLASFASPLHEVAERSRWIWTPADVDRAELQDALARFLEAESWPWERVPGKGAGGLDLRRVVSDLRWDGEALRFATAMGETLGLNPAKALGAILGSGPSMPGGLCREAVELRADPRAGGEDRYLPKLRNMYEDAVLLGGGSNVVLVDEDDDEPLRLG